MGRARVGQGRGLRGAELGLGPGSPWGEAGSPVGQGRGPRAQGREAVWGGMKGGGPGVPVGQAARGLLPQEPGGGGVCCRGPPAPLGLARAPGMPDTQPSPGPPERGAGWCRLTRLI